MNLLTNENAITLWQNVVKDAENNCSVALKKEIETYLVSLLVRYSNKPEVARQVFAKAFLQAMQMQEHQRHFSLQQVGDQCLLFAGLFPKIAQKRLVKINYFVDLGRSAYSAISETTSDLYGSLALQFVVLMDVLQSIRYDNDLSPWEAYEQWDLVGSKRAWKILKSYSGVIPLKRHP